MYLFSYIKVGVNNVSAQLKLTESAGSFEDNETPLQSSGLKELFAQKI